MKVCLYKTWLNQAGVYEHKQIHLFMQEYEKESPGWLAFRAKNIINIIYIKYWMTIILLKWTDFCYYFYVQQWGVNKAIMLFSKVSLTHWPPLDLREILEK